MGGEAKQKRLAEEAKASRRKYLKARALLFFKRLPKALFVVLFMPIWLPIAAFMSVMDDGKAPWES